MNILRHPHVQQMIDEWHDKSESFLDENPDAAAAVLQCIRDLEWVLRPVPVADGVHSDISVIDLNDL